MGWLITAAERGAEAAQKRDRREHDQHNRNAGTAKGKRRSEANANSTSTQRQQRLGWRKILSNAGLILSNPARFSGMDGTDCNHTAASSLLSHGTPLCCVSGPPLCACSDSS